MEILLLLLALGILLGTLAFVLVSRREPGPLEGGPSPIADLADEIRPTDAEVAAKGTEPTPVEPTPADAVTAQGGEPTPADAVTAHGDEPSRPSFRDRLARARGVFSGYVGSLLSRSAIDDETWDELEEALIRADVGVSTTAALLDAVRTTVAERDVTEPAELIEILKAQIKSDLAGRDRSLRVEPGGPNVWLFVGVNGVGKTTTIGKVAKAQQAEGRGVVLAAGDTFRAAAAEQLGMWADRVGAELVRGAEGSDPSAVIFDGVQKAASRDAELVLADTAGRLHTKVNLMEELRKVRRVADKDPGQVTEVLLVLDATTGQNGLVQAQQFTEAVEVTGVVLTKLDGSAKGGIVLAINAEMELPIKLVGLGESADDLVEFDPDEFVEALFS